MPIQTVQGKDFYNYVIKDAKVHDQDSRRNLDSISPSTAYREYSAHRQRKKQNKCKRLKTFLYNKEDKTSCNRTGRHWGGLCFYFAFFLGTMFILFFCYFYGINRTIYSYAPDKRLPSEKKFITSKVPTFTFVPVSVNKYPSPFVWYNMHGVDTPTNRRASSYVDAIGYFFKAQAVTCAKQKKIVCLVEPSFFGPCGMNSYGYEEKKPCLFLKLNTRSGWRPDAYHAIHRVPSSVPNDLKKMLDLNRETLCVYCSGTSTYDQEKIGKVSYYPEPCYNDSSFPFSDGPIDVNPTIAIQLPEIHPGYAVELTCQLFGLGADGTGEHQQSVLLYISAK